MQAEERWVAVLRPTLRGIRCEQVSRERHPDHNYAYGKSKPWAERQRLAAWAAYRREMYG